MYEAQLKVAYYGPAYAGKTTSLRYLSLQLETDVKQLPTANRQTRWNFGDSRGTSLSLDESLAQKEAAGVEFFAGKEPWLKGLHKLCTQEMDDLSQKAIKLVIEYCLEVLDEVEKIIRGKATRARLEAALDLQYADQFENKVFQYRWALRHPIVKDAITKALANRFPAR